MVQRKLLGKNAVCSLVLLNTKESFGFFVPGSWTTERDAACLVERTGDPREHFQTRVTPFPSSSSHIYCKNCGLTNSLHSPVPS